MKHDALGMKDDLRLISLARTFCDVGDLIYYMKQHQNVSGIQRVISSVVSSVATSYLFDNHIVWCMVDPIVNKLCQIDSTLLVNFVRQINDRDVSREILDQSIVNIEQQLTPCEPRSGDTFLIMGAFWVFEHASSMLLQMRRKGIRTALLVYDIIPIQHPEFCERSLTTVFARQMRSIVPLLDCALTISEHVKKQFDEYLRLSGVNIPTAAVPLGHDSVRHAGTNSRCELLDFEDEYVLVVGTIEIRKNHTYLLSIWKQLLTSRPIDQVPRLVLVGRQGWRVDDLMAQLEATDYLDGHVVLLEAVSDTQLDELYRGCLFTMFVSFSEGWGLPVGESLSRGKLCVASSATSIPEIGGDLPIYVDPYNISQGRTIVELLLDDRAYLAARGEAIVARFRPRNWEDYTGVLFASLEELLGDTQPSKIIVGKVPEAVWLDLGQCSDISLDAGLACTVGWYPREFWGRWMSERDAVLEFKGRPETVYRFIADLAMPPWLDQHGLKIYGAGVETVKIDCVPLQGGLLKTTVRADENGVVAVRFRCLGPTKVNPTDPRTLFVGLKRFIFYSMEDPLSYMRGIEQMTFAPLSFLA